MNSDVIRLLPDSVANQIAAGEVIQRPASVIKELVENAVDAGATEISIILKDAGRTLIQVVDNGCGMSPTDARMAFERHATSKISSAADLYSLHTMGFRGEALPSVAAVAQIDLRTMRRDDAMGTRLLISESVFESQEPAACLPGTNLMVKNIFFHMPARRKFLKKDSVELSHIVREFERLALVNTGIAFTLIHNDVTLHKFLAGTLKQRIADLFGKSMESRLVHLSTSTPLVTIEGFVTMPQAAKKRGYEQFLFVNGRNMRHLLFHKAILQCYEQLIAADAQPSYFINFTVDPATIDVNIHPQKHEIKFEHEQAIFQILVAAVRESLGKVQAGGAIDFDVADAPDIPLFNPGTDVAAPDEGADGDYNPFAGGGAVPASPGADYYATRRVSFDPPRRAAVPDDWQKLYESFDRRRDDALAVVSVPDNDLPAGGSGDVGGAEPMSTACMQLQERYIAVPAAAGLMIISQHRAHVRILFERYMATLGRESAIPAQKLMFGEDFELSASQSVLLESNLQLFSRLGFEFLHSGPQIWSIEAVPAPLQGVTPVETVFAVLERLAGDTVPDAADLHTPVALAMARAGAVKARQPLSQTEMETIAADLFRCAEPTYTPDGLPVMQLISYEEIKTRFEI